MTQVSVLWSVDDIQRTEVLVTKGKARPVQNIVELAKSSADKAKETGLPHSFTVTVVP